MCYPDEVPGDIDVLIRDSIISRRDRAARLLIETSQAGLKLDPGLTSFLEWLPGLPPSEVVRIFDDWWSATVFARGVHHATADVDLRLTLGDRLRWLFVTSIVEGGAEQKDEAASGG